MSHVIECFAVFVVNQDLRWEIRGKEDLMIGLLIESDWYLTRNEALFLRREFEDLDDNTTSTTTTTTNNNNNNNNKASGIKKSSKRKPYFDQVGFYF